jgi:hypothetical protein
MQRETSRTRPTEAGLSESKSLARMVRFCVAASRLCFFVFMFLYVFLHVLGTLRKVYARLRRTVAVVCQNQIIDICPICVGRFSSLS